MKNMKMKKILGLSAALLLAFTISASAQDKDKAPEKSGKSEQFIEKGIKKIKDKLDLTDAQTAQVRTIIQDAKAEITAAIEKMRAADSEQKPTLSNEFLKGSEAIQGKILSILTPEQKVKAEKFLQKLKEKIKEENEENEEEKEDHKK